jgi:phage tail sheath protein FI
MATLLSPGVYIEEIDASNIVPNVSNNVAFFAGNFERGPVDQPYVVTTKKELEQVFGYPNDQNYNEWFQCYKYFDYANQLVISRAFETSCIEITADNPLGPQENPVEIFKLYRTQDPDDNPKVVTNATKDIVEILTDADYDYSYSIGDWISFYHTSDHTHDYMYVITNIETVPPTNGSGAVDPTPKFTRLTLEAQDGSSEVDVAATDEGAAVMLHTIRHLNGGTQAFARSDLDPVTGVPVDAIAADPKNIDYVDKTVAPEDQPDAWTKRFGYNYDFIKNNEEWEYLLAKGGSNPLRSFDVDAKLKFFNKTASGDVIKIAIANPEDFIYNDGENYAIAFSEKIGINTENTYLTGLFQYYPQDGEVAIAIKSGDIVESFICSFDPLSVDGNNQSNYIENVINQKSKLVYVLENSSIDSPPATYLVCDRYGWAKDSTGRVQVGTPATNGTETYNIYSQGGRSPRVSMQALRDAYFTVEDKERYEIDVIIGNEYTYNGRNDQNAAIDLAESRKDCVAFIGSRYSDSVAQKSSEAVKNILNYILETDETKRDSVRLTRTMFAAFFANYFKIYDKYNKTSRYINVAGDVAGIRCQISGSHDAWWVSAGIKRGILKNIERLAFSPSQPQRDSLYKNGINPIVSFPSTGNLVWGNKTLYPIASSFDRINVRTLFNTLERSAAKAARSQVFEFNDPYTRNAMLSMFNPYLATIKAGRGITDYLVVCDETNNTPDVISRNELRVDIYIKPNYAAEMILLTFTNVGTRSFASVIGA